MSTGWLTKKEAAERAALFRFQDRKDDGAALEIVFMPPEEKRAERAS
jgi:hypothetical protein